MPFDDTGICEIADHERLARAYGHIASGWVQGAEFKDDRSCMQFALARAWGVPMEETRALPIVAQILADVRRMTRRDWPSLPAYNDADGRTQKEVLRFIERAYYRAGGPEDGLDAYKQRLDESITKQVRTAETTTQSRRPLVGALAALVLMVVTFAIKV